MSFERFMQECREAAGQYSKFLEMPQTGTSDLAMPCFAMAKSMGKNPAEIAAELAIKFMPKAGGLIKEIKAAGPYVNFYINYDKFMPSVMKDILSHQAYGRHDKKGIKIILEHTSINPSGPVHVGRLRNSVVGDSLKRILDYCGYDVETHYYVNDVGKQIAIITLGRMNDVVKPPESLIDQYSKYKENPDFKVFFDYVALYEKVENDPKFMNAVDSFIQACESTGDEKLLGMLKSTALECLEGQKKSLSRLGIEFDVFDFESSYIRGALGIASILEARKILKEQDGAKGLDLSAYGLERRGGLTTLMRSNGTTIYILRDLAYHLDKAHMGDEIINVLGEDHKIEFVELKAILENLMNFRKPLSAVFYSFVSFGGERLSTRRGQTAPLDMLLDDGIEKAAKMHEASAASVATAAIKYHMLKTDLHKPITFLWDDALRFEGSTGPYLQYTYARAASIMRKSGKKPHAGKMNPKANEIIKLMSMFPMTVAKCGDEKKPHIIANYLYQLASLFNAYYHDERIIGNEDEEAKLAFVECFLAVMRNGLYLMGIDALDEM